MGTLPVWKNYFNNRTFAFAAVAAIVAFPLAMFLYVAFSRLMFPIDLEWIEGLCMHESLQVALGRPLYTQPSSQYMATAYFPLYFVVLGFIFKATGLCYWAGRLVSIAATLGTGALAYAIIRRETKEPAMGLLAAGIWFAAFGYSGFFYDLTRVDAFGTFLLMAAYFAAFFRRGAAAGAAAGVLLALSAMTKQNHAAFVLPMIFAQIIRKDYRGAVALFGVFAPLWGGAVFIWDRVSGGWLTAITFKMVPFVVLRDRAPMIVRLYFRHFALASALILFYAGQCAVRGRWRELFGNPWVGLWASCVTLALVFQLTPGGWINHNMMPALGACLAIGSALYPLAELLREKLPRLKHPATAWLLPAMAVALVGSVYTSTKGQIPPPTQWAAARNLHFFVRAQPGRVFSVDLVLPEPNAIPFGYINYRDLAKAISKVPWKQTTLARVQAEWREAHPAAVMSMGDLRADPDYRSLVADMNHAVLPRELAVQTVTGKPNMVHNLYWPKEPGDDPLTIYAEAKRAAMATERRPELLQGAR